MRSVMLRNVVCVALAVASQLSPDLADLVEAWG